MSRFVVRRITDDGGELLWGVFDTRSRRLVAQYTRDRLAEIAASRLNDQESRYVERATARS